MAGMFYSLEQVVEKLGKTVDEVKELVRQGKLREFRDGANVLFKIEEVDELASEMGLAPDETEIELSPLETGEMSPPEEDSGETKAADLSAEDTKVDRHGINVLGESNAEYKLAEDTKAETHELPTGEQELGKIEDNVNLDSFGSGSGLLDLSLQADDTSLGADILDDIYPTEGSGTGSRLEEKEKVDMTTEAEQLLAETVPEPPQLEEEKHAAPVAAAAPAHYEEPEPDAQSKLFGFVLLLPLLVVIYTAMVILPSSRGITPAIAMALQNIIWYILAGVAVVAVVLVAVGSMLSTKRQKPAKAEAYSQGPGS